MDLSVLFAVIMSLSFWFFVIRYFLRVHYRRSNKKSRRRSRPTANNSSNQKTYSNPEEDPDFYKVLAHEINKNGDVIYNGSSVGYGFIADDYGVYLIKETPSGRDEQLIGSLDYVYHAVPSSLDANPLVRDIVAGFYGNYSLHKQNYHGYV